MALALENYVTEYENEFPIVESDRYAFFEDEEFRRSKFSKREDAKEIVNSVLSDYQYFNDSVKDIAKNNGIK